MTPAAALPRSVLVLHTNRHEARWLSEILLAAGLHTVVVQDVDQLAHAFEDRRSLVGVVAYETLWPHPQQTLRRLREHRTDLRLIVLHADDSPRLALGQRLWSINLIDHFLPRSLGPRDMLPIIRQAYADALLEGSMIDPLAPVTDPTEQHHGQQIAGSLRFIGDLSRGFCNQRRLEGLLRFVQRRLPLLLDYHLLQILVLEHDHRRLFSFPMVRLAHELSWSLAEAACEAVKPLMAEPIAANDLDILEQEPMVVAGDLDGGTSVTDDRIEIALPMAVHGELVGCLSLLVAHAASLTPTIKTVLRLVASQLGAAIRNAEALKVAEDQTLVDDLTGLHNRRHLARALPAEWKRAARYGHALTAVMIDIDHFKPLNDTCGHLVGDVVLGNFATLLLQCLRATDHAIRYGGDEFLLLLPETGPAEAAMVMERVRLALSTRSIHSTNEMGPLQISISAGIASYPVCSVREPEDLISLADEALLSAKRSGRDQIGMAAARSFHTLEDRPADDAQERRRFLRIDSDLHIRYLELPGFEGALAQAASSDISRDGIGIRDPERRLTKHNYALVFVEDALSPVLSRVMWTKDTPDGQRAAGLRFLRAPEIGAASAVGLKRPRTPSTALPKALVVANSPQLEDMIDRVLTAARYAIRIRSTDDIIDSEEFSEYALVVVGDSSLRGRFGEQLQRLRGMLKAEQRLVVLNEQGGRDEAIRTIHETRPQHFVPYRHGSDRVLFATLNKLLVSEYFGMHKYLSWGVAPKSWVVSEKSDKESVMEGIRQLADQVRCHPRVLDLLIAAVDEMLINAMYVERPAANVPAITVECGTDGHVLAVAVIDDRGLFRPEHLYQALGQALKNEHGGLPVDGGVTASLGFRTMLSCLSQLVINVDPGLRTEIIGIVDLEQPLAEYRRTAPTVGLFAD